MFRMEPINLICPNCDRPGYMYKMSGPNVGAIDVKCINCNSYFRSSELYDFVLKKAPKHACPWCTDGLKFTVIDDAFGHAVKPNMIHYCFACGRPIPELIEDPKEAET